MKKAFFIFLSLQIFCWVAQGQVDDADIGFNIPFSPVPGSAGTNQPSGGGAYFQQPNAHVSGWVNTLYVLIDAGTNEATSARIFQMKDDRIVSPILELTNETFQSNPDSDTGEFQYYQTFYITDEQVQNLAKGNWYAEIDYGSDQYVGPLTPTVFAAPTAVINIPSRAVFPPSTTGFVNYEQIMAPGDNLPATVEFDGSGSSDPLYLPLHYMWSDKNNVVATGEFATATLKQGYHEISLQVNDAFRTNTETIVLTIVSPNDALNEILSEIHLAGTDPQVTLALTTALQQAQLEFEHNNAIRGIEALERFEQEVRLQRKITETNLGNLFISSAQDIIEAVRR